MLNDQGASKTNSSRANILQYNHLLKANKIAVKSWLGHVKYIGLKPKLSDDYQHLLLSSSWSKLLQFTLISTFVFVICFATLFFLSENFSFFMAWNLSVQTFLTIGYGSLFPNSMLGNIAVYFEVFLSLVVGALLTGIVFLKFSMTNAPVIFSENICITNDANGKPILKSRLCIARNDAILLNPRYQMSLVILEESFEGSHMIRLRDLKLRTISIVLNANMSLVHDLDETSPLYTHWQQLYQAKQAGVNVPRSRLNLAILVTCVGVEEAFQTEVRSETVYYTSSLRFDMDFGDMFDEPGAFLNLPDTYRGSMDILKISDIVLTRHELKSESLLWIKNMLKDNMKRRLSYGRNLSIGVHDIEMAERNTRASAHEFEKMMMLEDDHGEEEDDAQRAAVEALVREQSRGWGSYCLCGREEFDVETETGARQADHSTRVYLHMANTSSACCTKLAQIGCHGSTWYWYTLKSSFSGVNLFLFALYTLLTIVFAIFICFDPVAFTGTGATVGMQNETEKATKATTSFANAFNFATHTLSSVGYGTLSPETMYSHWVVSIIGFLGWVCISTMSGVIWSRFAKPKVRITFAKNVVITMWNGERVLMVRLAGLFRGKPITECNLRGSAILKVPDGGGYKNHELKFVRDTNPIFNIPATFMHVIDETSPLFNIRSPPQALEKGLMLVFCATGFDSCFQGTVYTKTIYSIRQKQILFDHHYWDILAFHEDYILVDMHFFHKTRHDPPSFFTYCYVRRFFRVLQKIRDDARAKRLLKKDADKVFKKEKN